MKRISLVLTALLLTSGAAMAQATLDTVTVRPGPNADPGGALTFDCTNLVEPSPADLDELLGITDRRQTKNLSLSLMNAVGDACRSDTATLVVERTASGALTVSWVREY